MSPIKSTFGRSVGKLLNSFRERDLSLNSTIKSARFLPADPFVASGGITATPGNGYKYHFFATPGSSTFSVTNLGTGPLQVTSVEYLIVAGGGGGGMYPGGSASAGQESSFDTLVAAGGGGGGANSPGLPGGSGGGGGGNSLAGGTGNVFSPTSPLFPAPAPGQGNNGGPSPAYAGARGGGAGSAGESRSGGDGLSAFSLDPAIPPSYGYPHPSQPGRWFSGGGGGEGGIGGGPNLGGIGGSQSRASALSNTGGGGGARDPLDNSSYGAGGGGGGGFRTGTMPVTVTNYPVVVGNGGAGGPGHPSGVGGSGIVIIKYPES